MHKVDEKIKNGLFSADTKVVLGAINSIKQKGNKLYLPILFDILNAHPEQEIEKEIKNLLATVKDKDVVTSFVDALGEKKYKPIWKTILTTCWQNGLDFSESTPVFIDLIIQEEWEIAFESFTIIDNLEFLPSQEVIDLSVEKIKKALPNTNEQKTYFLEEILKKFG